MKIKRCLAALTAATALLCGATATAQQMPQLPTDKEVRIGKLPNGLTYYIRHNEYPKGQADFYIAQKVGSMQEEDHQAGLAHFLEHMCFNGTTHFPGKDLINYLESVGVKFGRNLNAMTGFDQTVYNISNVPVAREGVQDSCLLILHDWANDLLLLPEEIDAERAVIHEEWRQSNVGQMRILENLLPVIYQDEKYGHRLPIGTMEVVDNFPHQALRDYYETWYRPDLQGIIVVGDIDPDRIEAKIKEMFADIEMPADPKERVYFPVSDNKGTIYAIGHDKEQQNSLTVLMIKSDAFPEQLKNTPAYYAQEYVESMITSMLNTRLNDIASRPDAPFAGAQAVMGKFFIAQTKDALDLYAMSKDGDHPKALAAAYRELLRAVRGGFTVTEYDRARSEYLSRMERAYNNRRQCENSSYVREYINNFLEGEPIPGIEAEWPMVQMIAQNVQVAQINQALAALPVSDNRVLMALLPDNDEGRYPTDSEFAEALAAVDAETIEPFVDEVKSEPLIPEIPKPGTIVSTSENPQWGTIEWTLSNGAKVVIKKTDFKDDEILFSAVANGGYSPKFGDDYAASLLFMSDALSQYGLGDYSNMDLQKYLAGKQAGVRLNWSAFSRSVVGNTVPKDLPTLMELIYMSFTAVNFTADEFEALQKSVASSIHNQEATPQFQFNTTVLKNLYGGSPRAAMTTVSDVERADRGQIISISRAMTANAADFTFTFVGNVDTDALRPLVEQYIASLPGDPATAVRKVTEFEPSLLIQEGSRTAQESVKMETPQTYVAIFEVADMPADSRNSQIASMAGQILSRRLNDIVREKEGAVYSIGASGSMTLDAPRNVIFQTAFPMKPEMKDKVLAIIAEQFEELAADIKPEELSRVQEYMIKSYTEGKERNGNWLSALTTWERTGIDTFNDNVATAGSITADEIKAFVRQVLDKGSYIVVVLEPAE